MLLSSAASKRKRSEREAHRQESQEKKVSGGDGATGLPAWSSVASKMRWTIPEVLEMRRDFPVEYSGGKTSQGFRRKTTAGLMITAYRKY